mgnify:CR=1 FL=1
MSNKQGAFQGIKVLDLSTRLSGAWAARLFGDFGAEVLLPETADGNFTRKCSPFSDLEGKKPKFFYNFAVAYIFHNIYQTKKFFNFLSK